MEKILQAEKYKYIQKQKRNTWGVKTDTEEMNKTHKNKKKEKCRVKVET